MSDRKQGEENVIEEQDLLKSIKRLEAQATGKEAPAEEPVVPEVKTPSPEPFAKTVKEKGSEDLTKALDVSGVLAEVVDLVGQHVDHALTELAKTVKAQAEFHQSAVGAIAGFGGQLAELAKTIREFGDKASASPKSQLAKSAEGDKVLQPAGDQPEVSEAELRKRTRAGVISSLEDLAKSAQKAGDREDADRFTSALVKFETTGQIADRDLADAMRHMKQGAQ